MKALAVDPPHVSTLCQSNIKWVLQVYTTHILQTSPDIKLSLSFSSTPDKGPPSSWQFARHCMLQLFVAFFTAQEMHLDLVGGKEMDGGSDLTRAL